MHFIISEINEYIEKSNGNKYLTLVLTNESKDTKNYEELWNKIVNLIRSITKNSGNHDKMFNENQV